MGSWPSVARPPEVAELSRISVLGMGGVAGDAAVPVAGWAGSGPVLPEGGWLPGAGGTGEDDSFPAEGAAEGCVGAVLPAALAGCGLAMGACGVPERSFGSEDAGCCWAHVNVVSMNKKVAAIERERCIRVLRPTELGCDTSSKGGWMQKGAAQMAGCARKVKKRTPRHPTQTRPLSIQQQSRATASDVNSLEVPGFACAFIC